MKPSNGISVSSLVVDRRVQLEVPDHDPVLVDHPDVQVSHQNQHALGPGRSPDPDVVELGAVAQGEAAGLVDAVPADLGVGQERLPVDGDGGLVEGTSGLHRRTARAECGRSSL